MAGLFLLGMLVALGAAALLGLTADSRDSRYGVGPVLTPCRQAGNESSNAAAADALSACRSN